MHLRGHQNHLIETFPWETHTHAAREAVVTVSARRAELHPVLSRFTFVVPKAVAHPALCPSLPLPPPPLQAGAAYDAKDLIFRRTLVRWSSDHTMLMLPDRHLIQVREAPRLG